MPCACKTMTMAPPAKLSSNTSDAHLNTPMQTGSMGSQSDALRQAGNTMSAGGSSAANGRTGNMFSRFATRYVGKVAPVAAPAPHVAVSQTDLRHPKNVANIVAGQSDEDEINSETVSQLLAQQSDTSEMMLPTGTSGTAGKGNKAGKGSKAGKGTASIAGGGFLKKGISSLTGGKGGKDGKGSVIPSDTLSPVGVTSAVDSSAVIDATTVSAAKGEVAVGAADAGDQGEAGVDPTDADVANTAAALKDAADQLKAANVALKRATDAGKDDDDSDTTDASDAGTATLTNKKAAATTTTTTAKATKDDAGASGKAAKGGAAAVTADKKAGAKAAAKVSKGLVVFEANKDGVVESFNTADAPGVGGGLRVRGRGFAAAVAVVWWSGCGGGKTGWVLHVSWGLSLSAGAGTPSYVVCLASPPHTAPSPPPALPPLQAARARARTVACPAAPSTPCSPPTAPPTRTSRPASWWPPGTWCAAALGAARWWP